MAFRVTSVLCLLLLSFVDSSFLNFCTESDASPSRLFRIVGGRSTEVTKWPFQALFFSFGDDLTGTMCGGTILNEQWILTAAHCVMQMAKKTYINIGQTAINKGYKSFFVEKSIMHPQFDFDAVQNDIALVKILGKIEFNDRIQPVCLARDDRKLLASVHSGTVTGFGLYTDTMPVGAYYMKTSEVLRDTQVPIMEHHECEKTWRMLTNGATRISDNQICAGSFLHGTAPGDSGGPLLVQDALGHYIQVGITSFGANGDEGIIDQKTFPGVYTRVSPYIPWIQRTVGFDTYKPSSTSSLLTYVPFVCLVANLLLGTVYCQ